MVCYTQVNVGVHFGLVLPKRENKRHLKPLSAKLYEKYNDYKGVTSNYNFLYLNFFIQLLYTIKPSMKQKIRVLLSITF